jgi:hypothetical protein
MKWIELPTARKPVAFSGRIISHVHNDTGDRLRWADLALYKASGTDENDPKTFGREFYLLYTVGHSLAVHAADGCALGKPSILASFAARNADAGFLEPCPECNPEWPAREGVSYRVEETLYSSSVFLSAEALLDDLRRCASCSHRPHRTWTCACGCRKYLPGKLSQLGERLLREAEDDPDVDRVLAGYDLPADRS